MIRKIGRMLILLGIFLLAAAGGIVGYQKHLERTAGEQVMIALEELTAWNMKNENSTNNLKNCENEMEEEVVSIPDYLLRPTMDMPVEIVDGIAYVGVLEIPTFQLTLPVISETTKSALKIAPCRYTGSAYLDNLVIGAHNYAAHFRKIRDLNYGDIVTFTDIDGNVFSYEVANIEVLQPDQIEEMCSGEWPLSLYTCTPGGQSRVTVRCEKVS